MSQLHPLTVLLSPHVSEKTTQLAGNLSEYVFCIAKRATKLDVRRAVETIFDVQVSSVRVVNMKSKPARFGRIQGRHSAWKKAYVSLKPGQEIDLSDQ